MPTFCNITRTARIVARSKHHQALTGLKSQKTSLDNTKYLPCRGLKASSTAHGISPLSDPENKGQRQSGVNFDVLGSWNNRLELSVNVQQSIKRGSLIPEITLDNVGYASLCGRRKVNEDRILITEVKPGLLLFGIFDGHGSDLASQYAHDHFKDHVAFWIERGERNLEVVLKKAFTDLNNLFTRSQYKKQIAKGSDAVSAGTTATICLLHNDLHLYIGHVGDSRAILCREGKAVKLTREHTPDDEEERDRILATGGRITWSSIGRSRVNGKLEMTRSIGDAELKAAGVTAEPDTAKIRVRHSHDAFLVLCTDGIHHVLNSQQVVDIICRARDPHEAAKFTPDQALLFGSDDNCSVIVVPFGAWGKFASKHFTSGFTRSLIGSHVD